MRSLYGGGYTKSKAEGGPNPLTLRSAIGPSMGYLYSGGLRFARGYEAPGDECTAYFSLRYTLANLSALRSPPMNRGSERPS